MRHQMLPPIPTSSNIAMMATAVLLLPTLWSLAFAEQENPAKETSTVQKSPETEFAPRGQRLARDIKYGDWRKVCFKTPGTTMVCRTTISGTWETGQSAVRADLVERQGEGETRIQLFLPTGVYLQAGVKLRVDQGAQYPIPYVWCLTNTCIAAKVADPNLIKEMVAGKQLQLELVDTNVLAVSTSIPLDQFETVRKNDPLQVFQQDVDE
jgi:invasion protein IalB